MLASERCSGIVHSRDRAIVYLCLMSEGMGFNEAFRETNLEGAANKVKVAQIYTELVDILADYGK